MRPYLCFLPIEFSPLKCFSYNSVLFGIHGLEITKYLEHNDTLTKQHLECNVYQDMLALKMFEPFFDN